jgi:hypothetical protein
VAQDLDQGHVPATMRPDPLLPDTVLPDTRPVGRVLVACLVLAGLSLLLPSTITFDPFTWATWGREIVHLRLDTGGGPAWKPLPVLVDILSAPLGAAEKWVWLVVARAGGLLGVAMAYRLARGLAGRWAGVIAAGGVFLSSSFLEYLTAFGMSEPLLAGLALLSVERHLDGRHAQTYGVIFLSLLLRPEAFPFFLGYSIFMWIRFPRSRPWVVGLAAMLPVLWLLPDYLSSGDWLRSTRRAQMPTQGGPLLTSYPALAVVESEFNAVVLPIVVGAAIAMATAVIGFVKRREDRTVLALSLMCVGWLVEVALTTQARMGAGDERYLLVSVALGCVLAGVGWSRLITAVAARAARAAGAAGAAGAGRRRTWVRIAVVAVVVVVSAPFVAQRLDELSGTIGEVPYQAHKYGELAQLIDRAGGRDRVLSCAPVTVDIYQMPAVAWHLGIHQSDVVIAAGPKGTPTEGRVVPVATTGMVFRTRTTRESPVLPALLGSPAFHLVAETNQWQLLSTCGPHAA